MLLGFNLLLWTTHVTEEHFPLFAEDQAHGLRRRRGADLRGRRGALRAASARMRKDDGLRVHRRHGACPTQAHNCDQPRSRGAGRGRSSALRWAIDCLEAMGGEVLAGPFHQPLGDFTASRRPRPSASGWSRCTSRRPTYAAGAGIKLSIEPLNRFECYVLNTVADAAPIVRGGGRAELRPALRHLPRQHRGEGSGRRDRAEPARTSTTSTCRRTTAARRARAMSRSATDAEALKQGGYEGWFVIEAFGRALPALAAATRVWRDFFPRARRSTARGTTSCARPGPRPDTDKHTGEHHGDDHQGAGDLPGAVRGRRGAVQLARRASAAGPRRSATRACRSRPGTAASSISRRRPRARPIATRSRASLAQHGLADHRAVDPSAGPARRGASGLRRRLRRLRRRRRCAATRKARQEWAVEQVHAGGQGLAQPRPRRARHLLRRARLALSLSLAAAAGGPDRDRVRRARAGAGGRSSTPSTRPASTSATRSIRARTCIDGVTFEMFLERGRQPPALPASSTTQPLRAAAARLSRLHRPLPRAHQGVPRQGRRVQPDRAAGRLWRLPGLGGPRRPLPLARATARSISAASSRKLAAYDYRRLGRARMGMLPQASRGRRARGRAVHRATTSSA